MMSQTAVQTNVKVFHHVLHVKTAQQNISFFVQTLLGFIPLPPTLNPSSLEWLQVVAYLSGCSLLWVQIQLQAAVFRILIFKE